MCVIVVFIIIINLLLFCLFSVRITPIWQTVFSRRMQRWTCFIHRWRRWKHSWVKVMRSYRDWSPRTPCCWPSHSKAALMIMDGVIRFILRFVYRKICLKTITTPKLRRLKVILWHVMSKCATRSHTKFQDFCS